MAKRTPNSIKTEDLLKTIEEAPENEPEVTVQYKNDVLTFFSVFNIQTGTDKIKKATLFSIYKVWSLNPVKRIEFYDSCDSFLPITTISGSAAYQINQNAIKLTHSAYKEFKKESPKLKSKVWTKHFENFMDMYSIKPGEFWLEDELLYFIYDKYTFELKLDPRSRLNKGIFYTYADLHFPHKLTKHGKVYGVTQNITARFQPAQLERMRKAYEKENSSQSN